MCESIRALTGLTEQERELCREVEDEVLAVLNQSDQERREGFNAMCRRIVEELNALPLDERLVRVANRYNADVEGTRSSVADVTFAYDEAAAFSGIVVNVVLRRPIERIEMSFSLEKAL